MVIASHEMVERKDVEDARPGMRVHLGGLTGQFSFPRRGRRGSRRGFDCSSGAAASASSQSGHIHGSASIANEPTQRFSPRQARSTFPRPWKVAGTQRLPKA